MGNLFGLVMGLSSQANDLFWAVFSCFDRGGVSVLGYEEVINGVEKLVLVIKS